jgi:glycosyltransferase involved in cell wall biosynthesis
MTAGGIRLVVTAPWGERLGGAEAMLWSILRQLDRDRIDPTVVFLQAGPFERDVASLGFPTTVVPAGRLRSPLGTTRAVRGLAGVLRDRQPELVLNWSPKTQLYGGTAAKLAGMPDRVVWWQHGVPNGHWMDRLATALPTRAVGCSSSASLAAQRRLTPRREGFVVHPGVEPRRRLGVAEARELRRELGIPAERAVIGILGRLQPWKGQHRVIRAVAELQARGHDVHCLVVGGDAYGLSPEYERGLRALIPELGLEDRVTMTGQVEDPDRYVSLMDVLVNASDDEPFGIVLLEAMALEVPVVAPASAGPLEIVEPDVSGVLVDSPEPAELAAGVERLLADADWRREVAARGQERCLSRFSASGAAERLCGSLTEIVRGHA